MAADPLELRCFCSRRPLLGLCGRDANGDPFVHVKVFKAGRVFGEVVATGGTVRLRCRECLRWHKVVIKRVDVAFREEPLPDSLVLGGT